MALAVQTISFAELCKDMSLERSLTDDQHCSTLVYLEGDASLSTYEDSEGVKRQSLSIVQRTYIKILPCDRLTKWLYVEKLEILSPRKPREDAAQ